MHVAHCSRAILAGLFTTLAVSVGGQTAADHRLASRPETVVWGEIPVDRPAVLTIARERRSPSTRSHIRGRCRTKTR